MEIKNFQEFIMELCNYWVDYGCIWSQPYDANMGAGTFHPHTFLKGVGPEPWRSVYVQPCRRPVDGRYGKSPYRFQHYYQLQVLLKPSPSNIVDVFLKSLEHVGVNLKNNDIGLLEDDWKGPTLGAWGLGWEVRANGQEVTQFTYFQQLGGLDIDVVCGEITYGLERLFMYAKGYKNALEIPFNDNYTYGDIYYQNEFEFSHFNFNAANVKELFEHFNLCEQRVSELCEKNLVLPAYDYVLQASHAFNLLDARGAISVSERQRYIGRVRDCAKKCAVKYKSEREKLKFPLLNRISSDARLPILSLKNKNQQEVISKNYTNENEIYNAKKDFLNKDNLNVLFELGVEEMPPSFQISALKEINDKLDSFFNKQKEKFKDNISFLSVLKNIKFDVQISSRRLSVSLSNLPKNEPNQTIDIWGPVERLAKDSDGKLSPAGVGFCKKNKITEDQVKFRKQLNGVFLYAQKTIEGQDYPSLLAQEFKEICYSLNAPLKMKWLPSDLSPTFIRPVRWIVALVENLIIPLDMFGLKSGRLTCGQRILAPEFTPIQSATEYSSVLEKIYVDSSFNSRKEKIVNNANQLAKKIDGLIVQDNPLLEKLVGLFENPYVFIAEFDKKYLRLPARLISGVLREHMNYFSVQSKNKNSLLPYYVGAANYHCENTKEMIEGTKTVVVGRLEDGAFYYDTDLKTPLYEFREKLKNQLFQAKMGTLFEKTERIKKIALGLLNISFKDSNSSVNLKDAELILKAASEFCKADLKTGCVQEFPDEMQGVMGGVLVREQKVMDSEQCNNLLAKSIEEHYMPIGAQSSLPSDYFGVTLSLADKLDSLCLMLVNGAEPKGNKDPFGMRRLAIGIVRLLGIKEEPNALKISLNHALEVALSVINETYTVNPQNKNAIIHFIKERMKATLKEEYDIRSIEALSTQLISEPLYKVRAFASAIAQALKQEGKDSLLWALNPYRRAKNLTQNVKIGQIDASLFLVKEEAILYEKIANIESKSKVLLDNAMYNEFLVLLASLAEPLSQFFDSVMVNDPDEKLRNNRLFLLSKLCSFYENIADFSLIQVQ